MSASIHQHVRPGAVSDLGQAVAAMSSHVSSLGRDAAEVRGIVEDTDRIAAEQASGLAALSAQMGEVTAAQQAIGQRTQAGLQAVARARDAVAVVDGEVGSIVETLRQVSDAAGEITQIAMQTRLVAFNASVEAKRAGDAGRGFSLVADAVRDLAAKVESSSHRITSEVAALEQRVGALSHQLQAESNGRGRGPSGFHQALRHVEESVGRISAASVQSHATCAELDRLMGETSHAMASTGRALKGAMSHSEAFLGVSEHLTETVAQCGVTTENTLYLDGAQEAAAQIAALLEAALLKGDITLEDLFDEDYRPVDGPLPQRHTTRYLELAERLFPPVLEGMLGLSDKMVFCVATDRNGYVPRHNRKYDQPPRGDVVWDTAYCRSRRLFDDRTGLRASRNDRPCLLQTYRRHMSGGEHVIIKEADSPIIVGGKLWGNVRLGFQF